MCDQNQNPTQGFLSLVDFAKPKLLNNLNVVRNLGCEIINRGFDMLDKVYYNDILFIGINPSHIESDDSSEAEDCIFRGQDSYPKYFNIFNEVRNGICRKLDISQEKINVSHLDLFHIRVTKQEDFVKLLKKDNLQEFLVNDFKITCDIIKEIKPKAIVIANALASKIFKYVFAKQNSTETNWNFDIPKKFMEHLLYVSIQNDYKDLFGHSWCDRLGTYIIKQGELKGTPVIYSGMLTGGHALDVGSRERLIWHIAQILKVKMNNQ